MAGPFTTPVAESVPLENKDVKDNDFKAFNVQEGMEEIDFRRETLEPTGFLNLTDSIIGWDDGTRTGTIEPNGVGAFDYYIFGCKFTISSQLSIVLPDVHGVHILYLDNQGTGNLVSYNGPGADKPYDQGAGTGLHEIKVCVIYWDAVNQKAIFSGDARSLTSMPWAIQRRSHFVTRTQHGSSDFLLQNFINGGDGSLDAHAELGFSPGSVYHEDAVFKVIDTVTPANQFEQDIGIQAKIPIYYRSGTGNTWFKKDANGFPLYDDPGNLIFYNLDTAGTWSLANAGENSFVAIYYFATINVEEPIIGILGDISSSSPGAALNQKLISPPGLPVPAMSFIKAIVFQTSSDFTNTPKARLFTFSDIVDTISNDRYAILASYNGNANTGRWLEIAPSQASDVQPLLVPEDSFIRTVTLQSTANINAGREVGFFETGDLVTPRFTVTVPVGGLQEHQFDVTEFFNKGEKLAVQVTSGSINKPVVRFWIETSV